MKKLFKKSISCIVAVLMVLSSMPFTALTANAALVKQDIAVWDAANVTAATPGTGTKFTHTDSSTKVSINGVHWGSASKADGNGYVTFNNATISSEAGFASLNIKGDVWTFSSKFATTGSGLDDQNTQQTTNDNSTIFGIGTATTRTYSPSDAVKRSGMAADLVNITKNGNIYLAGSTTSSGTVANITSTSADDAKILTVAYDNGNLTISLDGTTAYTGTVDTALFSQGVANFFIGTSAQVYAGGTAPYYGLTNGGYYTYGTHLYSLSASVSFDLSSQIDAVKTSIDNTGFSAKTGSNQVIYFGNQATGMATGVTGVLYSNNAQNAYSDCNMHKWNMNGNDNTMMEAKVMAVTDRIVYLYSGDKSVIKLPVMAEFNKSGSTVKRYHVNYIAPNSTDWVINQNWTAPNNWHAWDTNTSGTEDGLYVVSYDPNHNVADFTSNSGGATGSWNFKNVLTYNGSLNFDENNSLTLTNPRFKNSVDVYCTWAFGGKGAFSNVGHNDVALGDQKTPVYKVFNYKPMVDKLADALKKYNQVMANESNYTPASVLNFYNAVKGLVDYNPNDYDFSTDNAFATATADMNRAIANYDNAVLVDAVKEYTVAFVKANGDTVKTVILKPGEKIGEFPANTATAPDEYGYGDIYHNKYSWDTALTAESVPTSDIRIVEKATPEAHSSKTPATCTTKQKCDACGATFGDFGSHNLTKTAAKDATCTEAGNSAYWTCSTCKKMFSDAEATTEITEIPTISASGHSLAKVDEVPSTCTVQGTEAYWTCTKCNKKFSNEQGTNEIAEPTKLPLADHVYVVTSTNADKHTFTCKNCPDTYEEAHTWGDYSETTPATCTANAVETATCTVEGCGATSSREVPDSALGHDYQYAELDADNHTVTCSRCDLNETKPHDFGDGNVCSLCRYVKTSIDWTTYDNAVAEYEAIKTGDYTTKYTAESRDAYEKFVDDEIAKKDTLATQEEVDAVTAAIVSAKTKLCLANVDIKVYLVDEIGVATEITELSTTKPYGTKVTVDVTDKLAANQMISKWTIQTQGTAVTTKLSTVESAIDIIATEPTDVYVSYVESASTEADPVVYSKVSFISKNGAVAFVKYVEEGTTLDTTTADLKLEIPFYEFKGWSKDTIYADGSDIEVKAIYEFIENTDNRCNVHYNGTTKSYAYDSFVYLYGAEGENLALAADEAGNQIITYLNENAFYAPHTEDIYVVVVPERVASIGITGTYTTSTTEKKTAAYNCKFYVPDGCTVVEYGLTATSTKGSMKIKGGSASARGEYCILVSMAKNSEVNTVDGVAYLTYKDSDDNLVTIYSTTVTQNL